MNLRLFLILAGALCLSSCGAEVESKKSTLKVKSEEAKCVSDVVVSSSYPGKVIAVSDVNLSFRVAGVIDRIASKEGEFIKEGQVVAYMDSRDYQVQLNATQAEYDAIKGEADRVIALYAEQSVSQNDYEKALSGIKQITAKLDAHRNAYEDTKLKAPFDGYIQKINFDRGEAVSAGMPIIKFVSASAPEVVVNLPVVEYMRRDDLVSASASVGILPGREFKLERVGVAHKANLNQLYETRFRVLSEGGVLPTLGVSTMVSLNYKVGEQSSVMIPFSGVVERDGECFVWQIVGGKAKLTRVTVESINRDGMAIISSGLSKGDVVITAGLNSLKEGMAVEPLSAPSKSNVGNIL